MSETIYVTGVVIANGIADSDGDVLSKKDIKTIFTKYVNRETDVMHKNIANEGVDVIANWISENPTNIANQNVPTGSWLATMKVSNPKLVECIREGRLRGFSLGSVSEEAMTPKYWFINKSMNYRDLESIEEVIPLFVSFVDYPANQFDFEVMSYETYINKNNKSVNTMTEKNEEMISVSALEKIRDLFTINKAEESDDEKEIEKEEGEPSATADETVTALFDALNTIQEQNAQIIEQNAQIIEAISKSEDSDADEEEEIEKAEENADSEGADESESDEEEIEKSEEEESSEEEKEDEDKSIEKRQTSKIENQATEQNGNFFKNTGRDYFGRKIK